MRRKNRFETYKEAAARGNYDEFPMLELGIDPQLHLSRNNEAQPFFLICEQDTIVPAKATEPLVGLVGSPDASELRLQSGHVGLVAGRQSAKIARPQIVDWIRRHSETRARAAA